MMAAQTNGRRDDGVTLAEMLAALAVIGLAIGGLGQGIYAIGRYQRAAAARMDHSAELVTVQDELNRVVQAADGDADLEGGDQGFALACGAARTCSVQISKTADAIAFRNPHDERTVATAGLEGLRFAYLDDTGINASWPPSTSFARLTGVAIFKGGKSDGLPLAYAPVPVQQRTKCEYDTISGLCRK
jgi:prepilin-type N-terminal cleavage/methylation domain-containing protein